MLRMNRLGTVTPKTMRALERDERGYPIPFIVLRDKFGTPQFTINDHARVSSCVNKKLCAICGRRLNAGFWFVGGSRCFLHTNGAFLDPPTHLECAEYALKVCPFLAARTYTKRIDDAKLKPGGLPRGMGLIREESMQPELPERFGLGHTSGYIETDRRFNVRHWNYLEFWRRGEPIHAPDSETVKDLIRV